MTTLVVATRNDHKVAEIREILGEGFSWKTLRDFPNAPSVVEDAATFAGNATKKAVELAHWLSENRQAKDGGYVLADDSGLEVDCLDGAPGVHSARFAAIPLCNGEEGTTDLRAPISSEGGSHPRPQLPVGAENSPDARNNEKLLRLLSTRGDKQRNARFRCVIAITPILPSPPAILAPQPREEDPFMLRTETFEGCCEGKIGTVPKGNGGFGYDPLFTPDGFTKTFAELGDAIKNRISHRAKALQLLRQKFQT